MWNIKHNNDKLQAVDMSVSDSIMIKFSDIIPFLENGAKYFNDDDGKMYEFCNGKWIIAEQ